MIIDITYFFQIKFWKFLLEAVNFYYFFQFFNFIFFCIHCKSIKEYNERMFLGEEDPPKT